MSNLIRIYASLCSLSCEQECQHFSGMQTVNLKMELCGVLVETLSPVQKQLDELLTSEQGHVEEILATGQTRAREVASVQVDKVKDLLGIL